MNMKANLNDLMKQAQEMQSKMQGMQKEIQEMIVTGVAGGGMVKVFLNGRYNAVKRPEIADSVLKDKALLGDLIAAAINDAVRKIETSTREKMTGLTKGLNLPPDLLSPFGSDNNKE